MESDNALFQRGFLTTRQAVSARSLVACPACRSARIPAPEPDSTTNAFFIGKLDWFLCADSPWVRQAVAARQNSLNPLKGLGRKIEIGTGLD
jgi:hypothetical protein